LRRILAEGGYREIVVSGGDDEPKQLKNKGKNQDFHTSKDEIG
jgi:hypothetical protein